MNKSRKTALVVDADIVITDRIRDALRGDFHVASFTSVKEAHSVIRSGYLPSIILLDVTLEGGVEFVEDMKRYAVYAEIPIVITSKRLPLHLPWLTALPRPFEPSDVASFVLRLLPTT